MDVLKLDRFKVGLEMRFREEFLDSEVHVNKIFDQVVLAVKCYVYGRNVDRYEITYPVTWRDAVLDAVYNSNRVPTFIRRLLPKPKYHHIVINIREIYPTLPVIPGKNTVYVPTVVFDKQEWLDVGLGTTRNTFENT